MGEEERREFLAWYESHEPIFDKRRVLECYCQDDVTVLRQACRVSSARIYANRKFRSISRVNNYRVGMQKMFCVNVSCSLTLSDSYRLEGTFAITTRVRKH